MKPVYKILLIITIAVAMFGGYENMMLAASQPESAISQSTDLCGGTGGNGQIISVGSNSFTLKLNNGNNQIIHLANQVKIETSTDSTGSPQAGSTSLADLKIGDRVTLVGGPNADGSFTADTVVVCASTGTENPLTARKENIEYKKVSDVLNVATMLLVSLIWLGIVAFLRLKKGKDFVYLLFFTIFYIYIYKVLDYTLLQFQSLLLLKYFVPDLMLNGIQAGKNLNLIPLATLTPEDVKTSLFNILMMMPFGFGLPFITNFRSKKVIIAGLLLSIVIEFLQLITGFMANTTFRVADINDLIFNTVGVAIGYMLFVGFIRTYRYISHNWKISANPILRYIAERPQIKR